MSFILEIERRYCHRFKASVPLVFFPTNTPPAWGQSAKTINVSECGVFFSTRHTVSVGLPVHVMVNIAERFSQRSVRLFTGRVKHIAPKNFSSGSMGIGVEFFYSEPLTDELVETMRTLSALLPKKKRAGLQQLQEVAETMAVEVVSQTET